MSCVSVFKWVYGAKNKAIQLGAFVLISRKAVVIWIAQFMGKTGLWGMNCQNTSVYSLGV